MKVKGTDSLHCSMIIGRDGQKDVQARFRKVFQRFTSGFYTRIGRTAKTATVEQVEKRSDELLSDVSELLVSELLDGEYLK